MVVVIIIIILLKFTICASSVHAHLLPVDQYPEIFTLYLFCCFVLPIFYGGVVFFLVFVFFCFCFFFGGGGGGNTFQVHST